MGKIDKFHYFIVHFVYISLLGLGLYLNHQEQCIEISNDISIDSVILWSRPIVYEIWGMTKTVLSSVYFLCVSLEWMQKVGHTIATLKLECGSIGHLLMVKIIAKNLWSIYYTRGAAYIVKLTFTWWEFWQIIISDDVPCPMFKNDCEIICRRLHLRSLRHSI